MDIVLTAEQTAALDAAPGAVRIVDCTGKVVGSLEREADARCAPSLDGLVAQPRRRRVDRRTSKGIIAGDDLDPRSWRSVLGRLVEVVRRIRARRRT